MHKQIVAQEIDLLAHKENTPLPAQDVHEQSNLARRARRELQFETELVSVERGVGAFLAQFKDIGELIHCHC